MYPQPHIKQSVMEMLYWSLKLNKHRVTKAEQSPYGVLYCKKLSCLRSGVEFNMNDIFHEFK